MHNMSEITSRTDPITQTRNAPLPMSPVFYERSFDSYDVRDRSSFAPFVQGRSSGIYIFEFANGQRYVGQTVNFVGRFTHINLKTPRPRGIIYRLAIPKKSRTRPTPGPDHAADAETVTPVRSHQRQPGWHDSREQTRRR